MNETGHKASTVRNKLQYCPKKTGVLFGENSSTVRKKLEYDWEETTVLLGSYWHQNACRNLFTPPILILLTTPTLRSTR